MSIGLLERIEVADGVSCLHASGRGDGPRLGEQRLGKRGFSRGAVSNQGNAADGFGVVLRHVSASSCVFLRCQALGLAWNTLPIGRPLQPPARPRRTVWKYVEFSFRWTLALDRWAPDGHRLPVG